MKRNYLIIGAGHQGLAMAAHFAINGEKVSLWNRSRINIEEIMNTKAIRCSGILNGSAKLHKVSDDLSAVLSDIIFIATPTTAYKDLAKLMAKILLSDTIIYLNPGRTFGAIEFYDYLKKNGCIKMPVIVEAQSIIYTCRKIGRTQVNIYALKSAVAIAHIGGADEEVKSRVPACIRDRFLMAHSVLETSFNNIGMILHCAPVLFNIGWIESDLYQFEYYYDGISETIAEVLERMDQERVKVASGMGIQAKSLIQWFQDAYHIKEKSIFQCIRKNQAYRNIDAPISLNHRYLDEDIPNGLVPIEYLGKNMGIDVSVISAVINLANIVKKKNYRMEGRRYGKEELLRMGFFPASQYPKTYVD